VEDKNMAKIVPFPSFCTQDDAVLMKSPQLPVLNKTLQKNRHSENSPFTKYNYNYNKIKWLLNNPRTSVNDLVEAVSEDQDLCDGLIDLVNSDYYGLPQRISTVLGAIFLLGFDAVRILIDSNEYEAEFEVGPR
jgi:HD-like signal output (HDOD) protein